MDSGKDGGRVQGVDPVAGKMHRPSDCLSILHGVDGHQVECFLKSNPLP